MEDMIPIEHDVAFMQKAQAVVPGIHAEIVRQKKKAECRIPRYARRAYKSKDKKRIEQMLARAIYAGFTKAEIFKDYKETVLN